MSIVSKIKEYVSNFSKRHLFIFFVSFFLIFILGISSNNNNQYEKRLKFSQEVKWFLNNKDSNDYEIRLKNMKKNLPTRESRFLLDSFRVTLGKLNNNEKILKKGFETSYNSEPVDYERFSIPGESVLVNKLQYLIDNGDNLLDFSNKKNIIGSVNSTLKMKYWNNIPTGSMGIVKTVFSSYSLIESGFYPLHIY